LIDQQKRMDLRARAGGKCKVCGKLLPLDGPIGVRGEAAHRIAKAKWTLKRYGEEVIDDLRNLEWTCHDHNSAVLITFNPVERERLVDEIRGESRNSRPDRLGA